MDELRQEVHEHLAQAVSKTGKRPDVFAVSPEVYRYIQEETGRELAEIWGLEIVIDDKLAVEEVCLGFRAPALPGLI